MKIDLKIGFHQKIIILTKTVGKIMDNLNKINLIQLTSTEVVNISGGNSILRKLIDYMGGWIAGKAFDEIAEYAADPDRQVDLNHARNGGWHQ